VAVPVNPSLVGADESLLTEISKHAEEGRLLGVRYERSGCGASLELVPDCHLPVELKRKKAAARNELFMLRDIGQILQRAPLAADRLKEKLDAAGAIRLEWATTQRWAAAPNAFPKVEDLRKAKCKDATHLVRSVHLGRFRLYTGEPKTDRYERLAGHGYTKKCRAEDPEGRTPACAVPIRLDLIALRELSQEPPEGEPLTNVMVKIPAGPFVRGVKDGKADERPARRIRLGAFEIDRTEVTAADYARCVHAKKCEPAGTGPRCTAGILGKENHPANCIDWARASSYCAFVGKRLPTEAEWEKAARGSRGEAFEWGDLWPPTDGAGNYADKAANTAHPHWNPISGYSDGFVLTAPVGQFGDTSKGPVQMGGNVAEWVSDWYGAKYYAQSAARDPTGPTRGSARVIRGGHFGSHRMEHLRLTHRAFYLPQTSSMYFGVRCAR
jgi:formylglycine-generating enzyme required for sulfatase activity